MARAGWCGMVMTDAKTPPVAFCPVWAYSFSYGQDSGVSSGRDLPTVTLHPDRCEVRQQLQDLGDLQPKVD